MSSASFYLVRHGHYNFSESPERLSERGRNVDAPRARDTLLAKGLGKNTLLLSSDAPRALQTAIIIGEGLGVIPVPSRIINETGNSWRTPDLDAVVEQALAEGGVVYDDSQELVVVTHAPVLATVRRVEPDAVGYGEVLLYERGTWRNPAAPRP